MEEYTPPLRNRVFHCLSELNAAISELTEKHNQTRFQGREYSRRQLFEERERPALKALPASVYELRHYYRGKVQKNGPSTRPRLGSATCCSRKISITTRSPSVTWAR